MRDLLVVAAGLDHGADEEGHDSIVLGLIVLVPGHDEQAVVLLCPLNIGLQVFLKPAIAVLNRFGIFSVVHVVDLVRDDDAYGRERGIIGGKTRHGLIDRCGEAIGEAVLPIDPGVMFTCIESNAADEGTGFGQVFGIADERQPRGQHRMSEIGSREGMGAGVVGDALRRSGK